MVPALVVSATSVSAAFSVALRTAMITALTSFLLPVSIRRRSEGADLATPPTERKDLPDLGCYGSGDLVEG